MALPCGFNAFCDALVDRVIDQVRAACSLSQTVAYDCGRAVQSRPVESNWNTTSPGNSATPPGNEKSPHPDQVRVSPLFRSILTLGLDRSTSLGRSSNDPPSAFSSTLVRLSPRPSDPGSLSKIAGCIPYSAHRPPSLVGCRRISPIISRSIVRAFVAASGLPSNPSEICLR
jgi:hypothetical protein